MIDMMVSEIKMALEQDLFMVALTSALTLPDICGKAKYPNKRNWDRYISWFDDEVTSLKNKGCDSEAKDMPRLEGSIVYSLRCSLLHEGNPNIDNEKLLMNGTKPINHFILTIEHAGELVVCLNYSKVSKAGERTYSMSIRGLCYNICDAAERYYRENNDKFCFDYELVDRDEQMHDLCSFAKIFQSSSMKGRP